MKEKIMKWYKMGLWTEKMIQDAVNKNILTSDEAEKLLLEG
jgi:hypothetical protein